MAHAQVVTTTTHKTLRGPRGGMVLCDAEFAEQVDKGCPMVLGGPLPHVMAAKAIALQEASTPEFRTYAGKIVDNARALAQACLSAGLRVLTGGTDNHLLQIDVTPFDLTGRQAETLLREAGMTLNKNTIPFDPNGPWYTSGLRVGTAALTTLGMGTGDARNRRDDGRCADPRTALEIHPWQKRGAVQQDQIQGRGRDHRKRTAKNRHPTRAVPPISRTGFGVSSSGVQKRLEVRRKTGDVRRET